MKKNIKRKRYYIKETWRVMFGKEEYETEVDTLKQVKEYINDWIESWKENAEDAGGKVVLAKTDYRTFARIHILNKNTGEAAKLVESYRDTFNLKVFDRKLRKKKIYNLADKQ